MVKHKGLSVAADTTAYPLQHPGTTPLIAWHRELPFQQPVTLVCPLALLQMETEPTCHPHKVRSNNATIKDTWPLIPLNLFPLVLNTLFPPFLPLYEVVLEILFGECP